MTHSLSYSKTALKGLKKANLKMSAGSLVGQKHKEISEDTS